mgnify:CR=1 FL=1
MITSCPLPQNEAERLNTLVSLQPEFTPLDGQFSAGANTQALADPEDAARISHREKKADRRRIKELERDLRRKEKALAEAAALLVLSKKLEAIFPKDKDEDA